ncbi:MAG: hypothetical protein FWB98_01070 [Defluviitaleaceae bacterium]|nr:hypothetical protein [Defluviitaleaceae bacterium]
MKKLFMSAITLICALLLAGCVYDELQPPTAAATNFDRGEWAENVYTNNWMGFTLTLPDDWEHVDESEYLDPNIIAVARQPSFLNEIVLQIAMYELPQPMTYEEFFQWEFENISEEDAQLAVDFGIRFLPGFPATRVIGNYEWHYSIVQTPVGISTLYIHRFANLQGNMARFITVIYTHTLGDVDKEPVFDMFAPTGTPVTPTPVQIPPVPADRNFTRGSWDENERIFSSEYLGLTFSSPYGWFVNDDFGLAMWIESRISPDHLEIVLEEDYEDFGAGSILWHSGFRYMFPRLNAIEEALENPDPGLYLYADMSVSCRDTHARVELSFHRIGTQANIPYDPTAPTITISGLEWHTATRDWDFANAPRYSLRNVLIARRFFREENGFVQLITIMYPADYPELADDLINLFGTINNPIEPPERRPMRVPEPPTAGQIQPSDRVIDLDQFALAFTVPQGWRAEIPQDNWSEFNTYLAADCQDHGTSVDIVSHPFYTSILQSIPQNTIILGNRVWFYGDWERWDSYMRTKQLFGVWDGRFTSISIGYHQDAPFLVDEILALFETIGEPEALPSAPPYRGVSHGHTQGNTFISSYFGLNFTTPAGWRIFTYSDLANAFTNGISGLTHNNVTLNVAGQYLLGELAAVAIGEDNVSVTFASEPWGGFVTAEEYIQRQREDTERNPRSTDLEIPQTTHIGGNMWYSAGSRWLTFNEEAEEYQYTYIFVRIQNDFLQTILISHLNTCNIHINDILAMFR